MRLYLNQDFKEETQVKWGHEVGPRVNMTGGPVIGGVTQGGAEKG